MICITFVGAPPLREQWAGGWPGVVSPTQKVYGRGHLWPEHHGPKGLGRPNRLATGWAHTGSSLALPDQSLAWLEQDNPLVAHPMFSRAWPDLGPYYVA
ncbi:hypothetical protein AMTR_s00080p00158500 [Amborella trichopoda]|uniref:Uncharacterized protein n=1 Tax=Amborella trichopoda TaxID=13333 RepID=W1PAJ6_AMBTC|nr:hypothetical protein AMTR_s00080p00158500 [Amborella trichopoda]